MSDEFERGRKHGLEQFLRNLERKGQQAWREQSDAQERYDRDAGERAGEMVNILYDLEGDVRGLIENPDYFGGR